MQGTELQDLEEGRNEWCNIPSAIRNSISRFNQLILAQSQYSHLLETKLNEQQNKLNEQQQKINEQQGRLNEQQNFIQELEVGHEQFSSLTQSALYLKIIQHKLVKYTRKRKNLCIFLLYLYCLFIYFISYIY